MPTAGDVTVKLRAETAEFKKNLQDASQSMKDFGIYSLRHTAITRLR